VIECHLQFMKTTKEIWVQQLPPQNRAISKLLVALSVALATAVAQSEIRYVNFNSANPVAPFLTWETAAANIQDAIAVANDGDEVVVTNGVYQCGERTDGSFISVNKPLTLRSVNGPESTVINGSYFMRCVYLANGASLRGFTILNGYDAIGAGILCQSRNAFIFECVLTENTASPLPPISPFDGDYPHPSLGGGVFGGTLCNCKLMGNAAVGRDGPGCGGGAAYAELNNCVLIANTAGFGGGATASTLNNCTIVGNSGGSGGGVSDQLVFPAADDNPPQPSTLHNCIVYDNFPDNVDALSTNYFSCTTPLPSNGLGNFTNAPLFVDADNGDFRLQPNSPCINAGNNDYVTTNIDLDSYPRISGGTVDVGAYEFVLTPRQALLRLNLLVQEANLGSKNKQPLLATLAATSPALDRGNTTATLNQLCALQSKIRVQVAPTDAALANELVAEAQEIVAALSGL
jgi:hypothetical protein